MAKRNIKQEVVADFDEAPLTGEQVEMVGNYPTLQRVKTGLYSFDLAWLECHQHGHLFESLQITQCAVQEKWALGDFAQHQKG